VISRSGAEILLGVPAPQSVARSASSHYVMLSPSPTSAQDMTKKIILGIAMACVVVWIVLLVRMLAANLAAS
jgi:hypothetical protein